MTQAQAKKVTKYFMDWLEYLDGRGIILTDKDMARKELSIVENSGYKTLERIFKKAS